MIPGFEDFWVQFGAVGLLIFFLTMAVVYLWKYTKKLTGKMLNVVENNSTVMAELCILIKANKLK